MEVINHSWLNWGFRWGEWLKAISSHEHKWCHLRELREESKAVPKPHILDSGRKTVAEEWDIKSTLWKEGNLSLGSRSVPMTEKRPQWFSSNWESSSALSIFQRPWRVPKFIMFLFRGWQFVLDALNIVHKVRGKHICRVTGYVGKTKDHCVDLDP